MAITNQEISNLFNHYATLLEIRGENQFRIRAYRNAARVVSTLGPQVSTMVRDGANLDDLPSIGKDLSHKLTSIIQTGHFSELDSLKREFPKGLDDLLDLPGIGPKRLKILLDDLHIRTRRDLVIAARHGMVRRLPGFGAALEASLLKALGENSNTAKRIRIFDAEDIAEPLVAHLRASLGKSVVIEIAGSFRRRKDSVGDLDILICGASPRSAIAVFAKYAEVSKVISKGKTRASVKLKSGLQVDLRVVPEKSYGAALIYFTGSKAHNIHLRLNGRKLGLKFNEYGVFRSRTLLAGRTEAEVYAQAGLSWIPPELREDSGEIEAAANGKLPALVSIKDIQGDLRCHTEISGGSATLEEMSMAARRFGYKYLAVTDCAKIPGGTHDTKSLKRQWRLIDQYNSGSHDITLLKGVEVDILSNGRLSLSNDVLRELDIVVAVIRTSFNLSRKQQNERIRRAMDNRYVHIIAHTTERYFGEHAPYDLDLLALSKSAREYGCALEVSSQPAQVDLNDAACRLAKNIGVKLAICSDASDTLSLRYMRYGVDQARRGWIESSDVLNTLQLDGLTQSLKR